MRALAALLLVACAAPAVAPPTADSPLPGPEVRQRRVHLTIPGATLLHQVAVDAPGRSDVMIGRMRFPDRRSYTLVAQAPMGMRLFTIGVSPSGIQTDVAGPLQGRFPAERLARDVAWVYLEACEGTEPRPAEGGYVLRCTREGATIEEHLHGRTLAPVRRQVREAEGRAVAITYDEYGWHAGAWHPRRIRLMAGDVQVEIVLSGAEGP